MRDLHAPSRRRHLSVKIFFVSFRQLRLKVWGLTFFLGSKIEPFSALLFLVFVCFEKPHVPLKETTESTSRRY